MRIDQALQFLQQQSLMNAQQSEPVEQMQDESEQPLNNDLAAESSSSDSSSAKIKQNNPNVCSNRICSLYKHTKHNQTFENNVENLCASCLKQYQKELYCFYCKQIYFESTDDGKEWIMCDECQRWVHTECADILTNGMTSAFSCLRCRKIDTGRAPAVVPARRPNNGRSAPNKVPQRRKTQECMLNNFGFFWQLSPAELAQDVEKLKQFMR